MAEAKAREKIVEALMALAGERPWSEVTLQAVAERAGVSLAELRAEYDGRLAILTDYIRQIDERVLKDVDPSLANEAQREQLFDILFARFEAHNPHKAAIRNIARAALVDPLLALELNRIVVNAMAWMLAAAGIAAAGRRGLVRAQGLALVWARVMRTYLDDDDPGLARTMAALDKRLREAERIVKGIDRLEGILVRHRSPAATDQAAPQESEPGTGEPAP